MPRVLQSPDALGDIRDIVDFIAGDNPAAAERWFRELDQVFQLLAEFPQLGQMVKGRRRTIRRRTFGNYVIYYRAIESGVEVVRVFHGARDHERSL